MTWFWYVAQADELMLDVDSGRDGSVLGPTRIRLEAAIEGGELAIRDPIFLYKSATEGHYHVIIQLRSPMPQLRRYVWEMQLRSDLYRGRCNLMRGLADRPAPALLISPKPWPFFYRLWDARCDCLEKHSLSIMVKCPVAVKLRRSWAAEGFFGSLKPGRTVMELSSQEGPVSVGEFARSISNGTDSEELHPV